MTKLCYQLAQQGRRSAMINNITLLSQFYAISRYDVYKYNANFVTDINNESAISASVIRDLLYMSYHQKHCGDLFILDSQEIEFMLNNVCTY